MKAREVSGGVVAAVILGGRAADGLIFNPPHCALPGLQVGAGLGTVAGAFGGVAAAGGAATLATCPSLAITTLAGSGMIGPAAPLVALLTGALLGGVAGGTAGGVYTCKVEGDHLVIQYRPPHHPGHYEPAFPVPGYNHHVHPLPYHETKHVPYHDVTYSVPQLHSYSKYDRLGETVDRLGFALNTTMVDVVSTPEEWLAKYLVPLKDGIGSDEVNKDKKDALELSQGGPSLGVLEAEGAGGGEMEAAIEEKKTYVEMLEKLLQFRLQQRQGFPEPV